MEILSGKTFLIVIKGKVGEIASCGGVLKTLFGVAISDLLQIF